ncbi:MAG: hypothetical protein AAF488_08790 [Planctomycetota bacterium]
MKFWTQKRRPAGTVAIRADRVLWTIAERHRGGGWSPTDGGVIEVDPSTGPEATSLSELWSDQWVDWGLVVPAFTHAGLFALPPLDEGEMARGVHLQIERQFSIDPNATHIDYEMLPAGGKLAGATATVSPNALLIALPKQGLDHWIQWAGRLPYPPTRLEPTLPALLRALRSLPEYQTSRGSLWIHHDLGSTVAVIASEGNSLALRELGPEHGIPIDPWADPNEHRFREFIVECEDRYPDLELETVYALGEVDPTRVAELAERLDLGVGEITRPTVPESLVADDGWVIPYGDLLEVGPYE